MSSNGPDFWSAVVGGLVGATIGGAFSVFVAWLQRKWERKRWFLEEAARRAAEAMQDLSDALPPGLPSSNNRLDWGKEDFDGRAQTILKIRGNLSRLISYARIGNVDSNALKNAETQLEKEFQNVRAQVATEGPDGKLYYDGYKLREAINSTIDAVIGYRDQAGDILKKICRWF